MKIRNKITIIFILTLMISMGAFVLTGKLFAGRYYIYKSNKEISKELERKITDRRAKEGIEFTLDEDEINIRIRDEFDRNQILLNKFWLRSQDLTKLSQGERVGKIFYQDKMLLALNIKLRVSEGRLFYSYRFIPSVSESFSIFNRVYIVSFLFSILLFSMLIYIYMMRVTKRLERLDNNLKIISKGEFEGVEEVEGEEEIKELSKGIIEMALKLKGAFEKIDSERRQYKNLFERFSHELKTPLTLINGYAQRMSETDKVEKYKNSIISESKRILALNRKLFLYGTFSSKNLPKEDVDLKELIEEIFERYMDEVKAEKVEVSLQLEEKYVKSNFEYLDLAIDNIVRNGIDFAKNSLKVNLYEKDRFICLDIENDGEKIQNPDKIWEPFYRENSEGRRLIFESNGLGLAISREIFEKLGIKATAVNLNEGVNFKLLFNS